MEKVKRTYRQPSVKILVLKAEHALLAGTNTIPTGDGGIGGNGSGGGAGWLAPSRRQIIDDDYEEEEEW